MHVRKIAALMHSVETMPFPQIKNTVDMLVPGLSKAHLKARYRRYKIHLHFCNKSLQVH